MGTETLEYGDITRKAGDVIPFNALVRRSAEGEVVASADDVPSAIDGDLDRNYEGIAVATRVEKDEAFTGFYKKGDLVPIVCTPRKNVFVLVRGGQAKVNSGDLLTGRRTSNVAAGYFGKITEASAAAVATYHTARDFALAKALEEVDVSTKNFASLSAAAPAGSEELEFTATGISQLNVDIGDYIIHGTAGNYQLNRVKWKEGRKIQLEFASKAAQAANSRVYRLVPVRAVLV